MAEHTPAFHLLLASSSPRRREILRFAGFSFDVVPAPLDEERLLSTVSGMVLEAPGIFRLPDSLTAAKAALLLAEAKAQSAISCLDPALVQAHPLLAADTVVSIDDLLMGKPDGEERSRWMLRRLSGQTHSVITAHVLVHRGRVLSSSPQTRVTFRHLNDAEIDAYVATGEPADKAGAYAIQGEGSLLISEVSGDYLNIVGLSVTAVQQLLSLAEI